MQCILVGNIHANLQQDFLSCKLKFGNITVIFPNYYIFLSLYNKIFVKYFRPYCYALGHTMPAFSLFYSAFCLFSRSLPPHIMQFAYLEQNAECNGMTQKQENEAICTKLSLYEYKQISIITLNKALVNKLNT